MKIENTFTVDAPIEQAWELLTDIPEIAPCLPGAKLTGEEDGVYSGGIKVKVGPVTAEYKGSAEFVEKDDIAYKAVINGKGRDTRGAGNAQALITAQMKPVGDQTQVDITTDLKVSGKVAQFGRGVMQDISEKLLGQFADCLAAKIGDGDGDGDGDAVVGVAAASAEGTAAESTPNSSSNGAPTKSSTADIANRAKAVSGRRTSGSPLVPAGSSSTVGNDDDDVLDLLDIAGGAMFKKFAPLAGGLAALAAIIWWIVR